MIDAVCHPVRSLGLYVGRNVLYVYMCIPFSCGLDKQAYHMWRCVLTARANKGTAELDARGKD